MLLFPVLPYVIKFLFWLISLPFKAIAALFKGIDNKRKKRAEAKAQKEITVKQSQGPPNETDGLEV